MSIAIDIIRGSLPSSASSQGSADSLTLVVSPPSDAHKLDFSPPLSSSKLLRGAKQLSLSIPQIPDMSTGKGFLEPHHTNLPRRRRRTNNNVVAPVEASNALNNVSTKESLTSSSEINTFSGVQIPTLPSKLQSTPLQSTTIAVPDASLQVTKAGPSIGKGHVQPHISHLPRRQRKPLTSEQLAIRRKEIVERRRCLQEIGTGSGVFVAFMDEDEEEEETSEEDFTSRFSGVVRIVVRETGVRDNGTSNGVTDNLFVLSVPATDAPEDGVSILTDDQIKDACAFLHYQRTTSEQTQTPSPILIQTPRTRPVDAFSLAVYYLATHTPFHQHFLAGVAELSNVTTVAEPDQEVPAYSAVHLFIMNLHDDIDAAVEDFDDDRGNPHLRIEWRGVLSFDGMDRLARLVAGVDRNLEIAC